LNVLIVEDDVNMQKLLTQLLESRGHQVTLCDNVECAWEKYQAGIYPFVILDILLPGVNGLSLSKKIRDTLKGQYSYILVITVLNATDDMWEILKAGADDYIAKPFIIDMLEVRLAVAEQQVLVRHDLKNIQDTLQQREQSLAEAQRIAHLGNWDWDMVNNTLRWSDEIYRIFGTTPQEFEATYEAFLEFVHPDDRQNVINAVNESIATGSHYSIEHRIIQRGGNEIIVFENGEASYDSDNKPVSMIGTVQDISERKIIEDKLEYLAGHDMLTGLVNRHYFYTSLNQALARARRNQNTLAVVYIDLDKFKPVNDKYGHNTGDQLLHEVGLRLKSKLRESDVVARLGGDEFAIIFENITSTESVKIVSENTRKEIEKTFILDGNIINIGLSYGLAYYPGDGEDADSLLEFADRAMYKMKYPFN